MSRIRQLDNPRDMTGIRRMGDLILTHCYFDVHLILQYAFLICLKDLAERKCIIQQHIEEIREKD